MEVTKWLKPSDSGSHLGDRRECAGRNASERCANLEKDNVRADPAVVPGKADTVGRLSEDYAPPPRRGSERQHVHKESARNTGSPLA